MSIARLGGERSRGRHSESWVSQTKIAALENRDGALHCNLGHERNLGGKFERSLDAGFC